MEVHSCSRVIMWAKVNGYKSCSPLAGGVVGVEPSVVVRAFKGEL